MNRHDAEDAEKEIRKRQNVETISTWAVEYDATYGYPFIFKKFMGFYKVSLQILED